MTEAAAPGHRTARMTLPPYGRQHIQQGGNPWVAIGPGAWELAKRKAFPVMVLPPDRDPFAFIWPVRNAVVTLMEVGCYDTDRLNRTAYALLLCGARRVIACREALMHQRVFPLQVFVRERDDRQAA